ncbi:MAG: bifunctional demethylmenaquinone methyltransferase/2-methoxy-6-polyprenyl-1,4-benzoquinol methylase UbiE [Ignavibacteriaceae bacterium]|nr:bifunctional demethylmenaquinone methyltransferase/2-methoxy-6-polyprenyl-1,4-benzoquinol methylase UbiE [Ignavibacteriaceae bacterium]
MQTIPAHSDKKTEVKRIFDSIAGSYDFLNHLLSAGVDFYWRRKALKLTAMGKDAILLDVACGTGDFAIEARKQGVKHIYGADFSGNMLRHFNKKSDWIIGKNVQLAAEHLPFTDAYFTNITVAFGVRNFYDIPMAFKEFARVIKQEGKVTILEFRMPTNPLIRILYNAYFKYILPLIGRMVSKDKSAYTYLPESVEDFDKNVDLVKLLKEAGFKTAVRNNLTFGLVQVVIGIN